MTATEHMPRVMLPGAEPVLRRALTLRWHVNPHAIREARPSPLADLNGRAERIALASLEWCIDDGRALASLRLGLCDEDLVIPLAEARGRWIVDREREHADFGDPLRLTRVGGRTVWARTDLLQRALGLRGGVYEGPFEA